MESTQTLIMLLIASLLASVFFSASETAMMSINRYRLKHQAKSNKVAKMIQDLLDRPDRLLGVILLGNTFSNIMAASVTTMIATEYFGEAGAFLSSIALTIVLLIFCEVTPKTLAALHPEGIAYKTSILLKGMLVLLYPLVWMVNTISNSLLKLMGVKIGPRRQETITREELRIMVKESAGRIATQHQTMLLRVIDLEEVTIEDIMITKTEVTGLNLDDDWDTIIEQLATIQYTFVPVYRHDIENVLGILHVRDALNLMASEKFNKATLIETLAEPYYVPEGTSLPTQLLEFQHNKRTIALVVNEYGDVQGLIALKDILEEIVGEFTTDVADINKEIHPQDDGTTIVDGSSSIRDLNRIMHWKLPTDGPKTLSGLIIEELEYIPDMGTCLLVKGYPLEVMQIKDNVIKSVRISQRIKKKPIE